MRAVFLDRDGVINELIHHEETETIDAPFSVAQFRLLPGVAPAIRRLHAMGFAVILVSNQPDIAKGRFTSRTFQAIRQKMRAELAREGAYLDAEYYCLHHPEAKNERLRVVCECRKPKPGLLLQAASEMSIDLSPSWMIGDNLTDIQAGKNAGTKTMLIGRQKCELCHLMDELDARPDVIVPSLQHAAEYLRRVRGRDLETKTPAEFWPL